MRLEIKKPRTIVGIAIAYKKSYPDGNYPNLPLMFLKGPNTFIYHNDNIVYPNNIASAWVENELAIVIKKKLKDIEPNEAPDYIEGYTIANDITASSIYGRDVHLAMSKSIDTFCPVGPYIETDLDTSDLYMKTWINDKQVQDARTSERIHTDYDIVSIVSKFITLNEGDIILTGTHPGKYANQYEASVQTDCIIKKGDNVKMEIEGIGILENKVI